MGTDYEFPRPPAGDGDAVPEEFDVGDSRIFQDMSDPLGANETTITSSKSAVSGCAPLFRPDSGTSQLADPGTLRRNEDGDWTVGGAAPSSQTQLMQMALPDVQNGNEARHHDFTVGATTLEDQEISQAIELSLRGQALPPPEHDVEAGASIAMGPISEKPARRNTAEENLESLFLRLSNEFTPLDDPRGDTLVYIGPPPKLPGQDSTEYAHVKKHFEKVHRMRSSQLKLLDSVKFNKFLGPMSLRAGKRLHTLNVFKAVGFPVLSDCKYYLDLRPPEQEDEAVVLVTDLTCTRGVLTWHLAADKYGLDPVTVLGTDEFNVKPWTPTAHSDSKRKEVPAGNAPDATKATTSAKTSPKPERSSMRNTIGLDYSPIRHRSAIERLLQAIQGNDPRLDSAPKVWNYFAIAKYFDCAKHETVSSWITRWLYTDGNANFIQSNPEVAYRMGLGIQGPDLVKDAFSILVGEKALLDVSNEMNGPVLSPSETSIHGRKLESLDDDERNRIDHAASSLVRRVRKYFDGIVGDMTWLTDSGEYAKLHNAEGVGAKEQQLLSTAQRTIEEYVRGRIFCILYQSVGRPFDDLDERPDQTQPFRPGTNARFEDVYNKLPHPMRLFTRTSWIALQRIHFEDGVANAYNDDPGNGIRLIKRTAVIQAVNAVNGTRRAGLHLTLDSATGMILTRMSPKDRAKVDPLSERFADRHQEWMMHNSTPLNPVVPESPGRKRSVDSPENIPFSCLEISSPKRAPSELPPSANWEKRRKTLGAGQDSPYTSTADGPSGPDSVFQDFINLDHIYANEVSPQSLSPDTALANAVDENVEHGTPWEVTATNPASAYLSLVNTQSTGEELVAPLPDANSRLQAAQPTATRQPFLRAVTNFVRQSTSMSQPEDADSSGDVRMTSPLDRDRTGEWSDNHASDAGPTQVTMPPVEDRPGPIIDERCIGVSQTSDGQGPDRMPATGKYRPFINASKMLYEFSEALAKKCDQILYPPHLFHGVDLVPTNLFDVLMCLTDDEWKYLPLWAGGCDDGSGGVFDEANVPNLEVGGFRGGKRGIGSIGDSEPSVSESDSGFEDIASEAVSTVAKASKYATDGTQTVKSLSDVDSASEGEFMRQDEIYEQILDLKMSSQEERGKRSALWDVHGVGDGDDGVKFDETDTSTIMGARSDVQGEMFHDIDDDDDQNLDDVAAEDLE